MFFFGRAEPALTPSHDNEQPKDLLLCQENKHTFHKKGKNIPTNTFEYIFEEKFAHYQGSVDYKFVTISIH